MTVLLHRLQTTPMTLKHLPQTTSQFYLQDYSKERTSISVDVGGRYNT